LSKGYKLLTEWNAERVDYGCGHSPGIHAGTSLELKAKSARVHVTAWMTK
jgi:hypothetical protein